MSDERLDLENRQEANVARLIRAGFGPASRPSPHAGEQAFRRLVIEWRAQQAGAGFPDRIVVLLTGVLLLMGAWLTVQVVGPGVSPLTAVPAIVVVGLLAANLVLVPVASLVIVLRRRYA